MVNKNLVLLLMLLLIPGLMFAQDENPITASDPSTEEILNDSLPGEKIVPVLPQTESSVLFIEGEDAVATNFNREPILNYSCSGYRTLQLNQATGLQGDSVYYADYVFYVEEDGVYEFWYGGTPPGNKDELLTSFSSPFRYILDSYYEYNVYREDVNVVGGYAPAYYWNYVSELTLSSGEHRITFEVPVRRSFDSKYFFYLDNFFLVKKENDVRILTGNIPEVFPQDMDNRSLDSPFKSIEDYEILIRDNPGQYQNYIEISMIYSLIGDYLSSLKNLRKALLLEPDDSDIMLLIAKNLIWKGAYHDGLYNFSDLLKLVPERVDYWAEAGKVAAWTGQYETSKDFFGDGIELFPDNLNLQANLGITYLWEGDSTASDKQFKLVEDLTGNDLDLNRELAEIFEVNGYPDKAIEIYKKILDLYPENLEVRFFLEDAYIQNSQRDKIDGLRKNTSELYEISSEFEKVLQSFYNKQAMKEKVIEDYENELKNDPDNLSLRKTLAEIYFWNGDKKRAIDEYLNILTNYSYRNIRETEKNAVQFYEFTDRNYALLHFLGRTPEYLSSSMKELSTNLSNYKKAVSNLALLEKKNKAVIEKEQEPDLETIAKLEKELNSAEDILAAGIAAKESFIEKYYFIQDQFESDVEYLTRLISDEDSANETFRKLAEGSQWEWDRERMVKELEVVYNNGLNLAGYVLGSMNKIEGNLVEASDYLDRLITDKAILKDIPFSLFQNTLWLGDNEKRVDIYKNFSDEIISYGDYVYDLVDYIDYLDFKDDEIFGYFDGDPSIPISVISKKFSEIKAGNNDLQRKVQLNIQNVHTLLEEKMIQGFYHLAEQTYLIRNELGDFYQNNKMFPEAIDQYRQVLAIDPWNLSAKYKLGLVHHWNGNWAKALNLYNEVYQEDPVFGNVTSFYNELAKQHADYLAFTGTTFADTSELSFLSSAEYRRNINGVFSMVTNYSVEETTLFEGDTSNRIHSLSLGVPIDLSLFTITPSAGIYMVSNDSFVSDTDTLDYLDRYDHRFKAGTSMAVSIGPVILDGSYSFDWERDSLMSGTSSISYQQGEAAAQLDLSFTKKPILKDTAFRLSGYGKYLDDENLIWGSFFEMTNSNIIISGSDIQLDIKGNFSYEDSTETENPYWSPDGELAAGGGLELLTPFMTGEDSYVYNRVLFASGYYLDGDTSGVSFEIGDTLRYERKEFSGYFRVFATFKNQTTPISDPMNYWSLTFELGGRASLPDLLSL